MRYAPTLIVLAAAATAHADGGRRLHLAVHGSLDRAAVGQALAAELAVEVEVVDGTCDLPCVDVSVDGRHAATVVYAPRSGAPRARTVALGSDAAQWPLVITLLAGNVVRDEVQDVLAALPPPALPPPEAAAGVPSAPENASADASADAPAEMGPAGAPVGEGPAAGTVPVVAIPVAPSPPAFGAPLGPEPEHAMLGLGLVPGLSTDLTHIGTVQHFLSLNLLVGVGGGSSGLSLSGIADIERGLVAGVEIGGVVAASRRVAGTQVAGVAAVAGDMDGVQVAGTAAVADRVEGIQAAGVAAVSRAAAGTQLAGVAAVAGGDASVQIAGAVSVARGTTNIQIAGAVNVAHRVVGLQIAPINVARQVDGVQIGVINYGGSADGFSFGLINIVPGGRYDLETAVDSSKTGTVLFRHGGRRWHNVYGVGGHPVDQGGPRDDVWMYGLGFGPSLAFGDTVIDLEAIGWQVNHGPRHESDVSLLGQLRLSVAHHWGPFALVAGGIFNTYITSDPQSPLVLERRTTGSAMSSGVTVTTWPSAFVGVRI